jgi:HlyD family secretion protein
LLIVAAGALVLHRTSAREEPTQRFRKARVERGDIALVVTATGTINPVTTVLVGSQVSGTIQALFADYNSPVQEGGVIAQIDPAIFQAQVEQAQANLQNARAGIGTGEANLQNAQANLVKADVALADARRTLDRNHELMTKGVISQSALDTAQTNYDSLLAQKEVARAQVRTATAQLEQAKAQAEQSRAALKVAETNLRYSTIRSPVNGTVISRNVDVGQTVAASLQAPTLFTIARDLTQMQVDTNVSEADIGNIREGQEATFSVDAYPQRTFRGQVSEIRNAPVNVQNVITYNVVIRVENKDLKLKPGMTANVSILLAHRENVLKVASGALRFQPESPGKGETGAPRPSGSPPGAALMERLVSGLQLSDAQRAQVEDVLRASRGEFQALREGGKPEEVRKKIMGLLRQKIWGFLTEEQRLKFEESAETGGAGGRGVPGRIWVLSSDGKPQPIQVVLGISDGSSTEILSGDASEGTEVIVEDTARKKGPNQSPSAAPFTRGLGR